MGLCRRLELIFSNCRPMKKSLPIKFKNSFLWILRDLHSPDATTEAAETLFYRRLISPKKSPIFNLARVSPFKNYMKELVTMTGINYQVVI